MAVFAAAGTRLYIGGVLDDKDSNFVLANFGTQVWTEIGSLENLGTFGDQAETISVNFYGLERTKKFKGTRDAGIMEVVAGLDYSDAGQLAVLAAEKTDRNYAFRIVFDDAPEGGTPSERLFIALVTSATEVLDEANSVARLNFSLAINSNIVKVAATGSGSAPDNTVLPSVTGDAEVGKTLTALPGTWTGSPTPIYSYQWFVGGEAKAGEVEATYKPVSGDIGKTVSVLVTATNVLGSSQAISAPTSEVS